MNATSNMDPISYERQAEGLEAQSVDCQANKEVVKLLIDAAECYFKASELVKDGAEKDRLRTNFSKVLKKAELVKQAEKSFTELNASGCIKRFGPCDGIGDSKMKTISRSGPRGPRSSRELSKKEQIILLQSAKLHGHLFPPWKDDPIDDEFALVEGADLFLDGFHMNLSPKQLESFGGWIRYRDRENFQMRGSSARQDVDLVQDLNTDCSVVAGICCEISRTERGHHRILSASVWPYDRLKDDFVPSPNGKYVFRLHFNGCDRKVVIDDRLPSSRTHRQIHTVDRNNRSLVWPALFEKAYLKIRGGYDFPGSNSATDLWALVGWIPETIHMTSESLILAEFWKRVYTSFIDGNVLITVGTGRITPEAEAGTGLASEHDYAVLDMRETISSKRFLLKNPGIEGTVWKGSKISEDDSGISQTIHDLSLFNEKSSPGTFWIDLKNVIQFFHVFHMNWNPALFQERQDIHFAWDLTDDVTSSTCLINNPQFLVSTSRSADQVWLLLSRHYCTDDGKRIRGYLDGKGRPDQDFKKPQTSNELGERSGWISIYVFDKKGKRVALNESPVHRGSFVDAPQTLVQVDIPADTCYTIVAQQLDLQPRRYNFTLSAFSQGHVMLESAPQALAHSVILKSGWERSTSGGRAESVHYAANPQFSFAVQRKANVTLLLDSHATDKDLIPVNVALFWSGGLRVTTVTRNNVVGESGIYRKGSALAEISAVEPGKYTIVCATWEPRQLAKFTLRVESDVEFEVSPLLPENAGRVTIQLPLVTLRPGFDRAIIPISPERLTRLKLIGRAISINKSNLIPEPKADPWRLNGRRPFTGYSEDTGLVVIGAPRPRPTDQVLPLAPSWGSDVPTSNKPGSAGLGWHTAPPHTPMRISVENGRGPTRRTLKSSGDGTFTTYPQTFRTEDIDITQELVRRKGIWVVVEREPTPLEEKNMIILIEVLADFAINVGTWIYAFDD